MEPFRPTELFPTPEASYQRALALVEVADVCAEQGSVLESLSLLLKVLQFVDGLRRHLVISGDSVHSTLSIQQLASKYQELLAKGESIFRTYISGLSPEGRVKPRPGALNQQIYVYAMRLGRTAAVAEEMEMWDQAVEQYRKGLSLLRHLLVSAPDNHAPQIQHLIQGFLSRLEIVTKNC